MALSAVQSLPQEDSNLLRHDVLWEGCLAGKEVSGGSVESLGRESFQGHLVVGLVFVDAVTDPCPVGIGVGGRPIGRVGDPEEIRETVGPVVHVLGRTQPAASSPGSES